MLKINNTWIRIRLNKPDKARVFANFLLENLKEISILKSGNTTCEKQIHPFDDYVIWPGNVALMNREPITLRNLLMRARLHFIYSYNFKEIIATLFISHILLV